MNPPEFRKIDYQHLRSVWKLARAGDLESLAGEDMGIARLMLDHEQYHDQFEMADRRYGQNYDSESEVNPFLHVVLHQIVENQLASKDPIEAFEYLNAMTRKRVPRHRSVHCIATIFSYLLHDAIADSAPFDLPKYKVLLKKYSRMDTEEFERKLEWEFGPY